MPTWWYYSITEHLKIVGATDLKRSLALFKVITLRDTSHHVCEDGLVSGIQGWYERIDVTIYCFLIVHALSRTSGCVRRMCSYNPYVYLRTNTYALAFVGDSPFAEGKSTSGSISNTNTDTGSRIPFRRGNAGSCILENIRTLFITHAFIRMLKYAYSRGGLYANFQHARETTILYFSTDKSEVMSY